MAWTSPATYTVAEVVTAAKLNTHVRDNLNYLKGAAGTIAFDAGATINGAVAVTGAITATTNITASNNLRAQHTTPGVWLDETDGGVKGAYLVLDNGLLQIQRRATAFGALEASVARIDITSPANALAIDSNGRTGLGLTAPQGKLHSYDSIAGFLLWEYDGLDGTSRTIIPDGAGDILYGAQLHTIVRSSGGTVQANHNGGTLFTPASGAQSIYNAGADNVNVTFNANGSLTVARSGGTLTYKVAIMLRWL